MDKQQTLGFILIALAILVWMWSQAPPPPAPRPVASQDTLAQAETTAIRPQQAATPAEQRIETDLYGRFFSHLAMGAEKVVIVHTDLYTAEITTKGGLIRKWELNHYNTWNGHPVHIVDFDSGGDLTLLFHSSDGKRINSRDLYFRTDVPNWKTVRLSGEESFTLTLQLPVAENKRIERVYTFTNGRYSFETHVNMVGMENVISNFEYELLWETGIRFAERNSVDEARYAMAYLYAGGELLDLEASSPGERVRKEHGGTTDWVATRNKYFAVALIPESPKAEGAFLQGIQYPQPDRGLRQVYTVGLKMPYRGARSESAKFTVFMGPLDIDIVRSFDNNLDRIMSLGAAWIIRPISEYLVIPLLQFLRMLIPNYGFVIIVFSIIVKVVLHPLTKTSMKSMKRMQALQPMMTEIREKYKDDPQKMNQAVMNLYKEYGVNPAAGCLPILLQMPILFALYTVFSSAIELRQAAFVGWIHDLSVPDVIVKLPFNIPLLGTTEVSGLALAMGVTMFIQQKMTITDPRQKAMVYVMPVMLTLLFNGFPSGLNLYYFVFNLLAIGQQVWMNKTQKNEPLKKVDRKKKPGGIMSRITKDIPNLKR
jgi:YidC/Oxa1 family membrane protein insertase